MMNFYVIPKHNRKQIYIFSTLLSLAYTFIICLISFSFTRSEWERKWALAHNRHDDIQLEQMAHWQNRRSRERERGKKTSDFYYLKNCCLPFGVSYCSANGSECACGIVCVWMTVWRANIWRSEKKWEEFFQLIHQYLKVCAHIFPLIFENENMIYRLDKSQCLGYLNGIFMIIFFVSCTLVACICERAA